MFYEKRASFTRYLQKIHRHPFKFLTFSIPESFSFLSCKALVSENIPFISSWPQCPRMANRLCARQSNSSVVCVSSYELTNVCSNFFPCLISSLLLRYCHKQSNELWDSLLNLLPDQPQTLNWTCNFLPWKSSLVTYK